MEKINYSKETKKSCFKEGLSIAGALASFGLWTLPSYSETLKNNNAGEIIKYVGAIGFVLSVASYIYHNIKTDKLASNDMKQSKLEQNLN